MNVPIEHVRAVVHRVRVIALIIAAVGIAGSYFTQAAWFESHDSGWISWLVPALVDLAAYVCVAFIQLPRAGGLIKTLGWGGLVAFVTASAIANIAGSDNPVSRAAHAAPVVMYLFVEMMSNLVGTYLHRWEADEAARVERRTTKSVNAELRAEIEQLKSEIAKRPPLVATPAKRPAKTKKPLTVAELDRPGFPVAPTSGAPTGPRGPYRPRIDPVTGQPRPPSARTLRRWAAKAASEVS